MENVNKLSRSDLDKVSINIEGSQREKAPEKMENVSKLSSSDLDKVSINSEGSQICQQWGFPERENTRKGKCE